MVLEFFFNQSTKRVASGEALPCENYQKQGLSSTDTFNIFWVSSQQGLLLFVNNSGVEIEDGITKSGELSTLNGGHV